MKTCKDCKVELVVGENISLSLWNNRTYVCKTCHYNRYKAYNEKWVKENRGIKHIHQKKYYTSIPAGVYCIKELNEVIYVGESGKPKRRYHGHFSKQGGKEDIVSKVNNYIHDKGKHNFSFEMLEYVDNKSERLERERYWVDKLNPKYNMY